MRRHRGRAPCGSPFDGVDHAVEIANDTEYGLAGHVEGTDLEKARAVARRIRAGVGEFGFHDYLETKGILGQGLSFTRVRRPRRA
ncbi:aldehyde dehydrogenase family protein, partial [Streptomyces mirabilis]|uniref:aldehyde dehydrogenase family protein n=1 Tax=Streptomyces mirabilis TaxID=68239 RepID=UPI0036DF1017